MLSPDGDTQIRFDEIPEGKESEASELKTSSDLAFELEDEAPKEVDEEADGGDPENDDQDSSEVEVEEIVLEEDHEDDTPPEDSEESTDGEESNEDKIEKLLSRYVNDSGEVDPVKLAKSLIEKERFIGQMSEDRKKLKNYDALLKQHQKAEAYQYLYENDKHFAKEVEEARLRAIGQLPPKETVMSEDKSVDKAEVNSQAKQLWASGDIDGALKLAAKSAISEFEAKLTSMEQEKENEKLQSFFKNDEASFRNEFPGLFEGEDGSGDIRDPAIKQGIADYYAGGKNLKDPLKKALGSVLVDLGRIKVGKGNKKDSKKAEAIALANESGKVARTNGRSAPAISEQISRNKNIATNDEAAAFLGDVNSESLF